MPANPLGLAKDGADANGVAAPTGGSGIRGWLSGIYSAVTGALFTKRLPDTAVTNGALTKAAGEGSELVMPVQSGMTMLTAWFKGVYTTCTVQMEISRDGGATYIPFGGAAINGGAITVTPLSSNSNEAKAWEAAIPSGATHIKARCTLFTSGTSIEVFMYQGSAMYETCTAAVFTASGAVIGGMFCPGQWTDVNSSKQLASAKLVAAVVDLITTATATTFNNSSLGAGEYRVSVTSNKPGKLYIATSRDNVTFKRIKMVELAKADSTCELYGEIRHMPSERYVRPEFDNGAEEATEFKMQQFRMAFV